MSVGLFDADMYNYTHTFFNLELMKMATYYNRKGELTALSPSFSPERYTKFIYRMDYEHPMPNILQSNIEYGGLSFSNGLYHPLPQDIERCKPNPYIYEKMRDKFTTLEEKNTFQLMSKGYHVRLSLDNKTVQDNYTHTLGDSKEAHCIFLHDPDITSIQDYQYALQEMLKRPSLRKNIRYGSKFPIKIRSDEEFEFWLNLPISSANMIYQINYLMSDDFIVNYLEPNYPSNCLSLDYVVTASSYDENDFFSRVLPKIYRQSVFFRHHRRKISLKYEGNFFSNIQGERLVDLLHSFIHIMQETKKENIRDYFYDEDSLYKHAKQLKRFPYLKKEFVDKDQAREVFEFVAQVNEEVFKDFYECHRVKLEGGRFVYAK